MSTKEKSIHDGHRERLRQRYEQNGIEGFSDHELLELILGYSISRKDTNPIGHALIEQFGNLGGVLDADFEDLIEVKDVGAYTAFLLKLLPGIARRYYEQSDEEDLRMVNSSRLIEFFAHRFLGSKTECLYAAFLDENLRLIRCEKQYEGSINSVEIHYKKIVRAAQRCGCAYVAIAHNHFTDTIPSQQDLLCTATLKRELAKVDVVLYDHIVLCGRKGTSMRDSGHFSKM